MRRRAHNYQAGMVNGLDEFTGTTAGTALNGRTAPTGGAWATSGAATDFAASDNGFASGSEEQKRATTGDGSPRYAILGATSYADAEVSVTAQCSAPAALALQGVIARWIDASNHVRAYFFPSSNSNGLWSGPVVIAWLIGGFANFVQSAAQFAIQPNIPYQVRLITFSSGRAIATVLNNGNALAQVEATNPAFATGGALASGKPGFFDLQAGAIANNRFYDSFYAATPSAEPVVIYPGRSIEIRSDGAPRQSADGLVYGRVAHRGSNLFIPPAGDKNRVSRIMVKADRNDLESAADTPLGDTLQAQVFVTPRYLAVPR